MNKKWAVKRITVNLTSCEVEKIEQYCRSTGRPATDVIRELIRSLEVDNWESITQQDMGDENSVQQDWSISESA